jgi:hypothetical protein
VEVGSFVELFVLVVVIGLVGGLLPNRRALDGGVLAIGQPVVFSEKSPLHAVFAGQQGFDRGTP